MSTFDERFQQRLGPIVDEARQIGDDERSRATVAREEQRVSEIAFAANRGLVTRVTSRIADLMPSIRTKWPFERSQWHEHVESQGGEIIVPGQGKPLGDIDVAIRPESSGVFATVKATLSGSGVPVYHSTEQRFSSDDTDEVIVGRLERLLIEALEAFARAAAAANKGTSPNRPR